MDNWLLIIVGTIFLICIAFGYVRGFLKLGLSLLSTIFDIFLGQAAHPDRRSHKNRKAFPKGKAFHTNRLLFHHAQEIDLGRGS